MTKWFSSSHTHFSLVSQKKWGPLFCPWRGPKTQTWSKKHYTDPFQYCITTFHCWTTLLVRSGEFFKEFVRTQYHWQQNCGEMLGLSLEWRQQWWWQWYWCWWWWWRRWRRRRGSLCHSSSHRLRFLPVERQYCITEQELGWDLNFSPVTLLAAHL